MVATETEPKNPATTATAERTVTAFVSEICGRTEVPKHWISNGGTTAHKISHHGIYAKTALRSADSASARAKTVQNLGALFIRITDLDVHKFCSNQAHFGNLLASERIFEALLN